MGDLHENSVIATFALPKGFRELLKEDARRAGVTFSQYVRSCLLNHLSKESRDAVLKEISADPRFPTPQEIFGISFFREGEPELAPSKNPSTKPPGRPVRYVIRRKTKPSKAVSKIVNQVVNDVLSRKTNKPEA